EHDAHEIVSFALVPVRARENSRHRGDPPLLSQPDLETDPVVPDERMEEVNDLVAVLALDPVDRAEVDEKHVLEARFFFEKAADLDDELGWHNRGRFVLVLRGLEDPDLKAPRHPGANP